VRTSCALLIRLNRLNEDLNAVALVLLRRHLTMIKTINFCITLSTMMRRLVLLVAHLDLKIVVTRYTTLEDLSMYVELRCMHLPEKSE
jgi:hypothetical protein